MAADGESHRVSRRHVLQGAGGAGLLLLTGCGLVPARAPAPPRPVRLGWLALAPPAGERARNHEAFLAGLRDYGYVEGENLVVERRYADGQPERYPALAADLVALPVDVIFASSGSASALAAQQATNTIPIVTPTTDLVSAGIAASLARPGGNVTGLSNLQGSLGGKRLELLKEALPGLTRVAALVPAADPLSASEAEAVQNAAVTLGIALHPLEIRDASEMGPAFDAARERADAVMTGARLAGRGAEQVGALALRHSLPSMTPSASFARGGALLSYGPDVAALHRRAAYYVDRILKGTKPADLPVEQPREFDFVINLRTAQALGLAIPPHVLLQATEVIQ
jgi:putative ABC transport system substrate-binding protein